MRYSDFGTKLVFCAGILWAATPSDARADCLICDEIITLNASRAACFLQNYGAIIERLTSEPSGRMSIDLDACTVEGEELETRGGLVTLPSMKDIGGSATGSPRPKSVYLMDAKGVSCLRNLVQRHSDKLNQSVEFDLFEDCPR